MKKNTAMLPMTWCQPAGGGDVLVEKTLDGGFEAGAVFEPVDYGRMGILSVRLHRPDLELAGLDLGHVAIQGRGAGPPNTFPSMEKTEVWQGQMKVWLGSSQ